MAAISSISCVERVTNKPNEQFEIESRGVRANQTFVPARPDAQIFFKKNPARPEPGIFVTPAQCIKKVRQTILSPLINELGLPQGSILSAILFSLFIE